MSSGQCQRRNVFKTISRASQLVASQPARHTAWYLDSL
jgi:hypothetical protein